MQSSPGRFTPRSRIRQRTCCTLLSPLAAPIAGWSTGARSDCGGAADSCAAENAPSRASSSSTEDAEVRMLAMLRYGTSFCTTNGGPSSDRLSATSQQLAQRQHYCSRTCADSQAWLHQPRIISGGGQSTPCVAPERKSGDSDARAAMARRQYCTAQKLRPTEQRHGMMR